MANLAILFTGKEFHWKVGKGQKGIQQSYYSDGNNPLPDFSQQVDKVLKSQKIDKIELITAVNHFTMVPFGFDYHQLGNRLISYNATINPKEEELMLIANKKYQIQFYFTVNHQIYDVLKQISIPKTYNFSGGKLLRKISVNKKKDQIHIHLYQNRVEFFVFKNGQVQLYNNLDSSSEVDFLYFIMFTVSKLELTLNEVEFFIYGNIADNETFLSELKKFSNHVFVLTENLKTKIDFIIS